MAGFNDPRNMLLEEWKRAEPVKFAELTAQAAERGLDGANTHLLIHHYFYDNVWNAPVWQARRMELEAECARNARQQQANAPVDHYSDVDEDEDGEGAEISLKEAVNAVKDARIKVQAAFTEYDAAYAVLIGLMDDRGL